MVPVETIRVLIVEDHQVVADGLGLALSRDDRIEVVGMATTVAEAVALAPRVNPKVVLLDYHLPDGTGADAARAIRADCPDAAVVVLTADGSDDAMLASIESGVCGFLLKSQAAAQVVEAVHRAAEGEMLIPAGLLAALIGRGRSKAQERPARFPGDELTARETEVLLLMSEGLDNHAIAERLVISYATVRSHVQNVLDKLGAHSKLEAVARASERGLTRHDAASQPISSWPLAGA
jgi:DNA-binding NarL/FixJ family response regulator